MARTCRKPHHSFEEKKLILERYLSPGQYDEVSPCEFAKICGVNSRTFYRWGRAIDWEITRIEELRRKKKKNPNGQSRLGEAVEAKIQAIKSEHGNWGPLKIKQYLFRHEQIIVPQTSVYKFLKARGLVEERKMGAETVAHDKRFEYEYPMAGVQMDLMHLTLANGIVIFLVTMLDDFSRFVLSSRFIPVKTMDNVIESLREVVRKYGVMDSLLTDYGSEFVSWHKFTRFEELLVDLDVRYIASGPDKKENQGKVERWHQTVREELRIRGPLDYSSEAQLWIRDVVDMYNFERPHQAIGGLLPADRFFGMREEIEAELERYRAGRRQEKQIYMVCRVGGRKLVVSGQREEDVTVRLDGKLVGSQGVKKEEIQLEKNQ